MIEQLLAILLPPNLCPTPLASTAASALLIIEFSLACSSNPPSHPAQRALGAPSQQTSKARALAMAAFETEVG